MSSYQVLRLLLFVQARVLLLCCFGEEAFFAGNDGKSQGGGFLNRLKAIYEWVAVPHSVTVKKKKLEEFHKDLVFLVHLYDDVDFRDEIEEVEPGSLKKYFEDEEIDLNAYVEEEYGLTPLFSLFEVFLSACR